jgi:uncharacterized surface protein with fasciclin (FAS1) repeats
MNRRQILKTASACAAAAVFPALPAFATWPKKQTCIDLVAAAQGVPELSTFVTAVNAAGLAPALRGPRDFTIFAPTNAAFAKVPAATLNNLLAPQNAGILSNLLGYHVVEGVLPASQLLGRTGQLLTTNGQYVKIISANGICLDYKAFVRGSYVGACNGIIHIIDEVLVPA